MLLTGTHLLPGGLRVRLRLAHGTDHHAVVDLAARAGRPCSPLDAQRLVRIRPRSRVAVCATAWVDDRHVLVGYAACDLAVGEPDVLLADEVLAPGVTDALTAALAERCSSRSAA